LIATLLGTTRENWKKKKKKKTTYITTLFLGYILWIFNANKLKNFHFFFKLKILFYLFFLAWWDNYK